MKILKDTVFKCDCGCGSELSIRDFGNGQIAFKIKEKPSPNWQEIIINPKDIKRIIKLLT